MVKRWQARKEVTVRDILSDVMSSRAYDRAVDNYGEEEGWRERMYQLFAKQMFKLKLADWPRYLKTECPEYWDDGILYWATQEEAFKSGQIVKEASQLEEEDPKIKKLLEKIAGNGIRGLALLGPQQFAWWWEKHYCRQNALNDLAGECDGCKEEGFDMTSIPPSTLDTLILPLLNYPESSYYQLGHMNPLILLRPLELSSELP